MLTEKPVGKVNFMRTSRSVALVGFSASMLATSLAFGTGYVAITVGDTSYVNSKSNDMLVSAATPPTQAPETATPASPTSSATNIPTADPVALRAHQHLLWILGLLELLMELQ